MRKILYLIAGTMAALLTSSTVLSEEVAPEPQTLITNVNVFDGVNEDLIKNANVLITGNLITRVSTENLTVEGATVINGGGRTLIPGLTDAHWHMTMAEVPQITLLTGDAYEIAARAVPTAEKTLMRGFTTVRDIGGNSFSLKKLIDSGVIPGPRMLVAGPPLSQTGGHYDYRLPHDIPSETSLDYWGKSGFFVIGDGVPEVRKRAREIFRMGASQIKIAAGGGVASIFDPLDVRQYSLEEMEAIVDVARSYNSYVAAHVFTDEAVKMAVKAGIKSIEHGMLLSSDTLKMMKKNGVWLSTQPLVDDEDRMVFPNPESTKKWIKATDGTDNVYKLAKKIGVKIAFGTDAIMDPGMAAKQGKYLSKLSRWFTPYEALKMATSDNAELMELAGPRHPYRKGPLGRITEGAYADLILVNGNPLEDLNLVADPDKNFDLIMKDGKVYKNALN
ncbi:metal-dependent hydrolase family protein [Shewanella psychrotolerans]|uniref:metal-dependent hydrolase family protein n=1 Tax=Shewanella psychrotolerans TaxID=2864206 RepID=UPI001C65DEE7|nr:amidohydrolase family protein [Shewanella psychrotolerans]QYK01660.1 amidohydrolase family protein [Shewanella psychrotolerans]